MQTVEQNGVPITGGIGRMTLQYTVWCAGCSEWLALQSSLKRKARLEAKRAGWTQRTKLKLWYCPACQGKE